MRPRPSQTSAPLSRSRPPRPQSACTSTLQQTTQCRSRCARSAASSCAFLSPFFALLVPPPRGEADARTRRSWAAFVHHVNYAICFGRPSALSLKQVHQPLPPLPDSPSSLVSKGASWPYEIRLQRIGLKVCWLNYTGEGVGLEDGVKHERVRQLWGELQEWCVLALSSTPSSSSAFADAAPKQARRASSDSAGRA